MTKRTKKHPATLTFSEFVSIDARGVVVHWELASVRRQGDRYVMQGPSGIHTLLRDATTDERLNAHWTEFADKNRRAA